MAVTAVFTMEQARAVLFAALDGSALTDVALIFDHDPLATVPTPPAIVTIFASGVDPDFFEFTVGIHYSMEAPDVAQRALGEIIDLATTALAAEGRVGPSNWQISLTSDRTSLVAESRVTIGREDF